MSTTPTPVPRGHVRNLLRFGLRTIVVVLAALGVLLLADRLGDGSTTTVVRGSGDSVSQSRSLPSFTAVELAGDSQITVRIGEQAVVVEADDNLVDRVTTAVRGGTLVVDTPGSFTATSPMRVEVTVPTLDAVVLSGTGMVAVDGVAADGLTVRVPGDGVLEVSGSAERVEASLSGSGDVLVQDLVARDVIAMLSGDGRLQVHATRSLDASVSGTGAIFYRGSPSDVTKTVTGTGVIVRS